MPQHIAQTHYPRRVHRERGGHKASDLEPLQLHGKQPYENCRKEKGRQAYAHHRKHGYRVIDYAVLMRRRLDTQRNRYGELKNCGDKGYGKGYAHILKYDVLHRFFIFERHPKVAPDYIEQPGKISAENSAGLIPEIGGTVSNRSGKRLAVLCHYKIAAFIESITAAFDKSKHFVERNDSIVVSLFGRFAGVRLVFVSFDGGALAFHLINPVASVLVQIKSYVLIVIRAVIPFLARYVAYLYLLVSSFLGIFRKLSAGVVAVLSSYLNGKKSIRHGKPVQFLDTVDVLLLHSTLSKRG